MLELCPAIIVTPIYCSSFTSCEQYIFLKAFAILTRERKPCLNYNSQNHIVTLEVIANLSLIVIAVRIAVQFETIYNPYTNHEKDANVTRPEIPATRQKRI